MDEAELADEHDEVNDAHMNEFHEEDEEEGDWDAVEDLSSPLIAAVVARDLMTVQSFLQDGADKIETTNYGCTAMWHAASRGHADIMQLLLDQGADKSKADRDDMTPILIAAKNGQLIILEMLLAHGADKDEADNNGRTVLFYAAYEGHLASVRYLVEQGADKEKEDIDGNSGPLVTASGCGHLGVVRYLVEQGTDMNRTNGTTALQHAARFGQLPVVQFLVEQGADIGKTGNGATPLFVASAFNKLNVVRYLLEQGANRDTTYERDGDTALHIAAYHGYVDVAMLLMSYGADLNARNNLGQLPIDRARNEEMKQAIRDEPRRRMDHGRKRATEQDLHPNASASANAQQEEDVQEEEEEGHINKKPRLEQTAAVAEEEARYLAEVNEDSEPSDGEDD